MNFSETNGSICDSNGDLLFYSNGVYIANALDDTMQNGSGLNPSAFTTSHTILGLTIPQGNLVIPIPEDSTKYYLFHETSDDQGHTYATYYLYYSIIDMSLDNGLGAVVQKNTVLLNNQLVEGRLTACKHSNGRDWWIFAHQYLTGTMFKYLVTPQGIQGPFTQDLQTVRDVYFGQCVFSDSGNTFAYYEPIGDLDIFDFDRCSGDFSNRVHIDINDSAAGGGCAFSRSGRYLYVSSMNYIYQYDMWASNIEASAVTVGVYDGSANPTATNFYLAKLAPDDKIYINCGNGDLKFHVIDHPDSSGLSCGFCQHCISLPAFNAFAIPNFPNYYLGAEQGTVCDSLSIGIETIQGIQAFNVFPNPAKNVMYIIQGKNIIEEINIFNSIGQKQIIRFSSIKNGEYVEVNVSMLTSGFYFLEMRTDKERIVRKFLKE